MTQAKSLYHRLGQWEPGEPRGSRRVLREPGGETPPGYSPLHSHGSRFYVPCCHYGLAQPKNPGLANFQYTGI